jgi:Zn-dependent M28 family amino/carboxypeptidase
MRKNLFALVLLASFVFQSAAQAPAVKVTADEKKIAEGVTAKQLSDYLYFVASDEMEGRDTPSRGLDTTAKFIAMNLSRWGFKPAGDDGTFFQKIALKRNPNGQVGRPYIFDPNQKYDPATMSAPDYVLTQNVVAIWEGRDPVLKDEMVAIGAHYDHLGIHSDFKGPDKIFNGADDDGSGTVSVLSIAEALAKAPRRPKRSVLFVWHCGEEKGLWGSRYFNKYPTIDITKVVAQLNIDMIGRSKKADDTDPKDKDLTGENAIYVIGSEMMSSTLGSVVKGANGGYLNLGYDYKYDDPKDPNRFFYRSDHFNYALNGIPITFWFDGVHVDYHQPGDEPQKIDYDKMEKVARTIMITLLELTDLKERPKVDKTLPPELTHRQ